MSTYWSLEQRETLGFHESTNSTLEDIDPPTSPAAISAYGRDFSLMAIVFAILYFLWIQ